MGISCWSKINKGIYMESVVLILVGGQSAEHEVSLISGRNIYNAMDQDEFIPIICGISKSGDWYFIPFDEFEDLKEIPEYFKGHAAHLKRDKSSVVLETLDKKYLIDAVFPALHGPMGEDGVVQGFLEVLGVPYVGCDVLSSAICMNKLIMKNVLNDANIPIVPYKTANSDHAPSFDDIVSDFDVPFFVKSASMGSSVGVHKVSNANDYSVALKDALKYSKDVLIEKFIPAREIECAVLATPYPTASTLGEVRPSESHDFYSYESKYLDADGAALCIPAKLSDDITKNIQNMAIETFKAMKCSHLARVDFFLSPDNDIFVNEINTMPGFTNISMYPKLWDHDGVSNSKLITRLLNAVLKKSPL